MRTLATLTLLLVSGFAQAQVDVPARWSHYPTFPWTAQWGVVVADLVGDGSQVAVVTGRAGAGPESSSVLAPLTYGPDGFSTQTVAALAPGRSLASKIHLVRPAGGDADLIAAVADDGVGSDARSLLVFAGSDLSLAKEVALPPTFRLRQVFDLDGDGSLELIGIVGEQGYPVDRPVVLDFNTGAIEWTDSTLSISDIAAGVIGSGVRVLVLSADEGPGRVLDAGTRATLWSWPDGFHGIPVFGEFAAGNGREFALVPQYGFTRVFRALPTFAPIFDFSADEATTVAVLDVNNDGDDDIVLGGPQQGVIKAYDTSSGSVQLELATTFLGIANFAFGDLDGNNALDIVFGAGSGSSGADALEVRELLSDTSLYAASDETGPHSSLVVSDVFSNGQPEVLTSGTESRSGYAGAVLAALRSETGTELRRQTEFMRPEQNLPRTVSLLLGEYDNDLQPEVVAGSAEYYDAAVRMVDAATLETQWVNLKIGGDFVDALAPIHASADSSLDVAVASGGRVVVLDGADGSELWRSVQLATSARMTLATRDDGTATQAVASLGVGARVYVFDVAQRALDHYFDTDGNVIGQRYETIDGSCELVLVFQTRLERRDCSNGTVLGTRSFPFPVTYVGFLENSHGPLVLSDGSRAYLEQLGTRIKRSEALDNQVGFENRGAFALRDGELDVYLGGALGVHRVTFELPIFADGFD